MSSCIVSIAKTDAGDFHHIISSVRILVRIAIPPIEYDFTSLAELNSKKDLLWTGPWALHASVAGSNATQDTMVPMASPRQVRQASQARHLEWPVSVAYYSQAAGRSYHLRLYWHFQFTPTSHWPVSLRRHFSPLGRKWRARCKNLDGSKIEVARGNIGWQCPSFYHWGFPFLLSTNPRIWPWLVFWFFWRVCCIRIPPQIGNRERVYLFDILTEIGV